MTIAYPTNPGVALGKAFLDHVRKTGLPETFETISSTKPPNTGDLLVLAYPVEIDRERRPSKDMAPCPICSPNDPKWLYGGSLIWCEETQAIYCVGPTCSTTGWASSRLTVAQNVFLQAEREKQDAAELAVALLMIERQITWIDEVLPAVQNMDKLHNAFAKEQPAVRAALRRATKSSPDLQVDIGGSFQNVGRVAGAGFLTSSWQEAKRLGEARRKLLSLTAEVGDEDASKWAISLAPTARKAKLKVTKSVAETLEATSRKVMEAAAFLSDQTFKTLGRWARAGGAPTGCSINETGTTIEVRGEGYPWRARAAEVTPLAPVPT